MGATSVPRWGTAVAGADPVLTDASVRCVLIVTDSTDRDEVVRDLVTRSVPVTRVVVVHQNGAAADELGAALADARVGWRFVVVGAEASVGRIRSRIVDAGAIDAEIVVLSTEEPDVRSMRRRDVFCGHCHVVTGATTAVDGTVDCSGCGSNLTVYYHYSRRHAAFLGFRADAEDLP